MLSLDRGGRPHPLKRLVVLGALLALAPGAAAAIAPAVAALALAPGAAAATAPAVTQVKTGVASAVGYASATLTGTVGGHRRPTTYFFQYGPTTKYGSQSQPEVMAAGDRATTVTGRIVGLNPVTRYHFRLVAIDLAGTALGDDMSFSTTASTLSVTFAAAPSPAVFGAPLTVAGAVNGPGGGGRTVVLQQNPYPFTGGFQSVGNPQVTSPTGAFEFNLISLPVTTQFLVVTAGPGQPASGTLTEYVNLATTLRVTVRQTHRGYSSARFSGMVAPAEVGGRVSLQRLVGGQWRLLVATTGQPAAGGVSTYAMTLHIRHGGYYRVFAAPVEDGHAAGRSQPVLVHVGGAGIADFG